MYIADCGPIGFRYLECLAIELVGDLGLGR
jgi:hypothetical protein